MLQDDENRTRKIRIRFHSSDVYVHDKCTISTTKPQSNLGGLLITVDVHYCALRLGQLYSLTDTQFVSCAVLCGSYRIQYRILTIIQIAELLPR